MINTWKQQTAGSPPYFSKLLRVLLFSFLGISALLLPASSHGFSCAALFKGNGKTQAQEIREIQAEIEEIEWKLLDKLSQEEIGEPESFAEVFETSPLTNENGRLNSRLDRLRSRLAELQEQELHFHVGSEPRQRTSHRGYELVPLTSEGSILVPVHIQTAIGPTFERYVARAQEIRTALAEGESSRLRREPEHLEKMTTEITQIFSEKGLGVIDAPRFVWSDPESLAAFYEVTSRRWEQNSWNFSWIDYLNYENRIVYALIPSSEFGYTRIKTAVFRINLHRTDFIKTFAIQMRVDGKEEAQEVIDVVLSAFSEHAKDGENRLGEVPGEFTLIPRREEPGPDLVKYGLDTGVVRATLKIDRPESQKRLSGEGTDLLTLFFTESGTKEAREANARDVFDALVQAGIIHLIH